MQFWGIDIVDCSCWLTHRIQILIIMV
jgi:hypothetical protein